MKFPRILSLYIAREVLQYAALGFGGVGAVLLSQNLLRQLTDFASVGLRFGDVVQIVSALFAMLSAYAVPVAFLFGVLVAVGRLSADVELHAMRALGVSLAQFAAPFFVLALAFSACTWWLLNRVEPDARMHLRSVGADIARRGALIEAGRFRRLDRSGTRLLFVDSRDDAGVLRGVVISDRSNEGNPFLVVAEDGRFWFDASNDRAHLLLEKGDVHFELANPNDSDYRRISFQTFDYAFELGGLLGDSPCLAQPSHMPTWRVREVLDHFRTHGGPPECVRVKTPGDYEIQLQRRLALPLAPILFAALGVALGIRRSRGARSWGILLCIGLTFGYYVLLSFGTYLAEQGKIAPTLSMWLPNLVFGAAAIPLLARARNAES